MYASCEQLFQPHLKAKPVVVLSNNDGCVIARSAEAKALGIPMGAPMFKIRDMMRRNQVEVFSSNYTLYGNMSARVMETIESLVPQVEVYSIDEAFADLTGIDPVEPLCRQLKETIYRNVGLPVCVGASSTKTLAKLANRAAKKYRGARGVIDLTNPQRQQKLLALTDVSDVWGVGPRLVKRLRDMGIQTALDLAQCDPEHIRSQFSVVLARTVRELNGESCIELETAQVEQQQIMCSRSFGQRVTDRGALREALVRHTANACQRLRAQSMVAGQYSIFIRTSPFSGDPYYANSINERLPWPTDDTGVLLKRADRLLDHIWRDGFRYAKAGVMLTDLYPLTANQPDLFQESTSQPRRQELLSLVDRLNRERRGTVTFASEGQQTGAATAMRQDRLSPRFTTRFDEVPRARLD
jgi:DNA polymerase V